MCYWCLGIGMSVFGTYWKNKEYIHDQIKKISTTRIITTQPFNQTFKRN